MTGPLSGFRVIDLTAMVSGPLATMILADQGADVIKVERPGSGDYTRLAPNRQNGFSASFLNNNRNKRSLTLDLKQADGLAILKQLVVSADVFIQNFRPGVAERMGIGENALRSLRDDLVYVSISGFGEQGPYAGKPVYDPLVQALSGLATVQAGSDAERPKLVRTILPDKLTGYAAAQAVTAALLARSRTGKGDHVRVSMLQAVIDFLWHSDMASQTFVDKPIAQQKAASFIDLIYATTDGYISVAVQSDKEWAALTRALDTPEWLEDARFRTPALRQENINERLAMTQAVLENQSSHFWLERLEAEDVPCAPVLSRSDVLEHAQIQTNDLLVESSHPQAGRLRQSRSAANFSEHKNLPLDGAPELGRDTRPILKSLGYDENQINDLTQRQIVSVPEHD